MIDVSVMPLWIVRCVPANRRSCSLSGTGIFQCVFQNRMINGEALYSSVVLIQVEASLLIISSSVTFMDFCLG